MNRIAIVTDAPGWHGARLQRAFAARDCSASYLRLQDCALDTGAAHGALRLPGFAARAPGAVFVRGIPGGSFEQVTFWLSVLHALAECGTVVYNCARAIERSVDKSMTSFLLARAGIPTPPCWVCTTPAAAGARLGTELAAGRRLVLKPLFGSRGRGLVRLERGASLPAPEEVNGVYYLQRYVDTGEGAWHDWRVFVIGGRAVAAVRRQGSSWITNVASGALVQPAVLTDSLRELAQAAVDAVGMHYAGVDILRDGDGRYQVIEVNGIPAWKGLQAACNLDIAGLLADDLLRHVATRRAAEAGA